MRDKMYNVITSAPLYQSVLSSYRMTIRTQDLLNKSLHSYNRVGSGVAQSVPWLGYKLNCRGIVVQFGTTENLYLSSKSVRACILAYPACNSHAPYCHVICGLPGSTIFFDIIPYKARLSKKKMLLNIKRVFLFSVHFSKTFLILRRIQRDIAINVKSLHV